MRKLLSILLTGMALVSCLENNKTPEDEICRMQVPDGKVVNVSSCYATCTDQIIVASASVGDPYYVTTSVVFSLESIGPGDLVPSGDTFFCVPVSSDFADLTYAYTGNIYLVSKTADSLVLRFEDVNFTLKGNYKGRYRMKGVLTYPIHYIEESDN